MKGSTFIIEFHGFRRFGFGGGPLLRWLHLGFVSCTWIPMLLDEWLMAKIAALRGVKQMHSEMACFGETDASREQSKR